MNRLRSIFVALTLLATPALVTSVQAQNAYPIKSVTLIVPFSPGGVTDILARLLSQKLTAKWDHPIVVENRAGAGGNLGTATGARATPDGYTLTFVSIAAAISQSLYPDLGYDLQKDFKAVAQLSFSPLVLLASSELAANDVQEMLKLARAEPGKLNFASAGTGTSFHLAGEMLKATQNVDIVHVPYKGGSPATQSLMGGQTHMMFNNIVQALPQVQAGTLKALGVTGKARAPIAPEIPTMVEQGLQDFVVTPWFGILAPAGTPDDVVKKLNADINAVLAEPDVQKRLAEMGSEIVQSSPQDFTELIDTEIVRWSDVVKSAGVTVD